MMMMIVMIIMLVKKGDDDEEEYFGKDIKRSENEDDKNRMSIQESNDENENDQVIKR